MRKGIHRPCELCYEGFITRDIRTRFCSQKCLNEYRTSTNWNKNISIGTKNSPKAMKQVRELGQRPRTKKQIEASRANMIMGNKLSPTQKQRDVRRKNAMKLHKLPRTLKQLNNCVIMHNLPKNENQLNQIRLLGLRYGKNSNGWKDGISPLRKLIRNLKEADQWRLSMFIRDNYKCQKCGERGGCLVAHHKKEFKFIFQEFLKQYNQFSPSEEKEALAILAIKYEPFWGIDNGITLCKKCHKEETIKMYKKI